MKLWKALGLAGLAGVAATGVIIVRDERRRAQLTPEEVRQRLQERVKDLPPQNDKATAHSAPPGSRSGRSSIRTALRERQARRREPAHPE